MDTNANNLQMNVFNKGMNTDTSDAYIGEDLYRFAKNLRYITDTDSNSGELRLIEGYKVKFGTNWSKVYAATQIRNYGIFVVEDEEDNQWSIYREDFNDHSGVTDLVQLFGPCDEPLGDNVSLVTRWESDENIKLYIADGKHQLMSMNIYTDENFVPNTDIKYLIGYNSMLLPLIECEVGTAEGTLTGPVILYTYRLYSLGGGATNSAPISKPIVLYDGSKGYTGTTKINKSILLKIPYTYSVLDNSNLNRLLIFRIEYVENGQPPLINIIYDSDYNGSRVFNYTDFGYNISEISVADFIATTNLPIKPVLIESKNNYLFAANILYDQDEVDDLFKDVDIQQAVSYEITSIPYELKDDNTADDDYGPSLMRGETYRYGIVFYDKKGRRSSVKHIADIEIPEWKDNTTYNIVGISSTGVYSLYKIGVHFTVNLNNFETARNNCGGYEIVRCNRTMADSKTITLGIFGLELLPGSTNTSSTYISNPLMSTYAVTYYGINMADSTEESLVCVAASLSGDIATIGSPESVYLQDDLKNVLDLYTNLSLYQTKSYLPKVTEIDANNDDTPDYVILGELDHGICVRKIVTEDLTFYYVDDYYKEGLPPVAHIRGDVYTELQTDFWRATRMTYIRPNSVTNHLLHGNLDVQEATIIKSPQYNEFSSGDTISLLNSVSVVDTEQYINWFAPMFFDKTDGNFTLNSTIVNNLKEINTEFWAAPIRYVISSGKSGILLKADVTGDIPTNFAQCGTIDVVNLRKPTIPYGGTSLSAKDNSVYYSFGNYSKYDASVTNDIDVFDGDVYLAMFHYNSSHAWRSNVYHSTMHTTTYSVPIESRINLLATYGDTYHRVKNTTRFYYLQDYPCEMGQYTLDKPAYAYNTVYSTNLMAYSYSPIVRNKVYINNFDTRVVYSNEKTNGENIDSWLTFKSANFIDVDTRYGEITDLRLFKDTLVFWQNNATGVLSVNERTVLQDQNDTNIILGNGDILQRYDYITTEYGMKPNQCADCQSNSTLYWWDGYRKEILGYSGGLQLLPMKKVKTISNYINQHNEVERPSIAYNIKYDEVLMSVVDGENNAPLVYNEMMQQFTSVYDTPFKHKMNIDGDLYLIGDSRIYKFNEELLLVPYLKYIVNKNSIYNKTFDNVQFGGRFYGGGDGETEGTVVPELAPLSFTFRTPLKQQSLLQNGQGITNREYDFRFAIPRNNNSTWGDRMRGKIIQCEMTSSSTDKDFSLLYIITKFRISYS